MTAAKRIAAIFFALLAGICFLIVGAGEFNASRQLAREGKTTNGAVQDHETVRGRKGSVSYYLRVEFKTADGQVITRRLRVEEAAFERAVADGETQVHYLPSRPSVCQVGETVKVQWTNLLLGVVLVACALLFGVFLRRPGSEAQAADSNAREAEKLSQTHHEYAAADAPDFKPLDPDKQTGLTEEELRRLAGKKADTCQIKRLHAAVQERQAQDHDRVA